MVDGRDTQYEDLPARQRRRLLVAPLLRSFGSALLLVVIYYWLPLDRDVDVVTAVVLGGGICAFGVLLGMQVRAITRSPVPRLRALEVLFTGLPFFLLVFAAAYFSMGSADTTTFSEPLTRTDALYFTVTVFSTVGFGDITPKTGPTRVVTMLQMLGDLLIVGVGLRLLLGAVQVGLRRRSDGAPDEPEPG